MYALTLSNHLQRKRRATDAPPQEDILEIVLDAEQKSAYGGVPFTPEVALHLL